MGIPENRERKTISNPYCSQISIRCPSWNRVAAKVAWFGLIFNIVVNLSSFYHVIFIYLVGHRLILSQLLAKMGCYFREKERCAARAKKTQGCFAANFSKELGCLKNQGQGKTVVGSAEDLKKEDLYRKLNLMKS
jgi:hypothetical protein